MSTREPVTHPASNSFGGQAVVEGVMIRGPRSIAVAVRRPDGEITIRTRVLGGRLTNAVRRIPLVRGILVLWETLATGIWALAWAGAVHNDEVDEHGESKPFGVVGWAVLLVVLGFAVSVFFAGPVLLTSWLSAWLPDLAVIAIEGVVRVGLLLGYIRLIGRSADVQRVFQYHAAEHKAVQALEQGRELSVQSVRRLPKEHPRCGTSFLLTVAVVAAVAFMFAGLEPLWWRFASRLVLIPVIAAVSYEAIRFGGLHLGNALVRTLFSANLALQKLTTRDPDDEQIQVAIASLNAALQMEREATEAARG